MANTSTTVLLILATMLVITTSSAVYDYNPIHQEFLDPHNRARAAVGVCPLMWDDALASYAMRYAQERAGDCLLQHSGGPYGENLAAQPPGPPMPATAAVMLWASEKPFYDYVSNSCVGGECLHYTQVVWKNSVRVGCARVQCSNGGWFLICSYDPPGNYVGQRPY